jgi:hypothetical protein
MPGSRRMAPQPVGDALVEDGLLGVEDVNQV